MLVVTPAVLSRGPRFSTNLYSGFRRTDGNTEQPVSNCQGAKDAKCRACVLAPLFFKQAQGEFGIRQLGRSH